MFELRSHVQYFRTEGGKPVCHEALVIGKENPVEGESAPRLHLGFIDPNAIASLGGANYQDAFDVAWSVPHDDKKAHHWYDAFIDPEEQIAAMQECLDESARIIEGNNRDLAAKDARIAELTKPSAADLDAMAAEDKAKSDTAKEEPKPAGVSPKGKSK